MSFRTCFAVLLLIVSVGLPLAFLNSSNILPLPDMSVFDGDGGVVRPTRIVAVEDGDEPVTLITDALVVNGVDGRSRPVSIRLVLEASVWAHHACLIESQILSRIHAHVSDNPDLIPNRAIHRTRADRRLVRALNKHLAPGAVQEIDLHYIRSKAEWRTDKVYICANGKVIIAHV